MTTQNSPAPVQTTQGYDQDDPIIQKPTSEFGIENLRSVTYGRVRYTFDLVLPGVRLLECKIVAEVNGELGFVVPPSVKEHFTQAYRATAKFEPAFERVIFAKFVAAIAEPAPAPNPQRSKGKSASSWADEQEAKFEAALAGIRDVA